jgi:hypothetical protein
MKGDDDFSDEELAALAWLDTDEGRQACAEWAAAEARRAKGGRPRKGSTPGKTGNKERKAEFDRRQRMLGWADDHTELARRLPREQMDRVEASRIFPDKFLAELDAKWGLDVRDWERATGRTGGPQTKRECLALQAWRHDRARRPPAPPPRNWPTARYEEPWFQRIEQQVQNEHAGGAPDFPTDYAFRQALKRALARVGPVKDLKLRSGGKRPAVTAYAAGAARSIEPTEELRRLYLAELAKVKRRRRK